MEDLGGPALWQKVERTWVRHGAKEGRYSLGINPANVGACTGVRTSEEEEEGASRALWSRGGPGGNPYRQTQGRDNRGEGAAETQSPLASSRRGSGQGM